MAQAGMLSAGARVRQPVWDGKFYSADEDDLRETISALIRQACPGSEPAQETQPLRALIFPHAGYQYAGPVAAYAACRLKNTDINKVILIGPDHRIGFQGGAISAVDAYATPLGQVRLHADAAGLRSHKELFRENQVSDLTEHSLEVVLPYLQVCLKDFALVPIVLGPCQHREIAEVLQPLIDSRTLLVISADLSHYLPYAQAVTTDRQTIDMILNNNSRPLLTVDNRSCGKYPIAVLLQLAAAFGWRAELLHYANSGDTTGDRQAVVGYAAIAFFGEKPMPKPNTSITQEQGQALVLLARKTLLERFGRKLDPDQEKRMQQALAGPTLQDKSGVFVTLKKHGELRGCIGTLQAYESIVHNVSDHALNAAFHDPRFSPLKDQELEQVCIEVSVLTKPHPLTYADADDLVAKLRPSIDGVTIRKGYASATFLPQVWEQLPRTEDFLSHLCMKAGLSSKAWRDGGLSVETYQVQYFEEPH
jgi:AmmeMemoRadiSam system protein B/AmmeMemoRadiSam system protein A